MKTLIISDLHLTHIFSNRKYRLLKEIIEDHDRIILNGDFWDGFLTTFDKFINSKWEDLFKLLKSKETIYLYGNHDPENLSDERKSKFSSFSGSQFQFDTNKYKFIIEHGDKYFPKIGARLGDRVSRSFIAKIALWIYEIINHIQIRLLGYRFNLNNKKTNRKILNKVKTSLKNNEIFVFGHTHFPEIKLDQQFANSGFFHYGLANYLSIDASSIILHSKRY